MRSDHATRARVALRRFPPYRSRMVTPDIARGSRALRCVVGAALALSLSGCFFARVNRNDPIDAASLAQLVPGTTTAQQAVELLGGPTLVVQLGDRSAYRYDHTVTKATGLLLGIFNVGHTDTREDRLWLFFDLEDRLTHVGTSLQSHRASYALPWEDLHDPERAQSADRERGLLPQESDG